MINSEELRIGNRVFWKPDFANTEVFIEVEIISISQDRVGYIQSHMEHRAEPFEDDVIMKIPEASFEELFPIPLAEMVLKNLDGAIAYPKWIQYLHELQNWFYWQNEKRELQIND